MKRLNTALLSLLLLMSVLLSACGALPQSGGSSATLDSIPAYSGQAYVELNGNQPTFTEDELVTESFETYSPLDSLGRCGVAYDCVDGKYLYNRCHLIGYQLTAENANKENLITGTRYLNVEGMLPFENLVADYVKETENHVLYRVTPIFEGDNLVASGVQMEAMSVEDKGEGVCFNVYCYNVQPGVAIDYATGDSWLEGDAPASSGSDSSTAPEETSSGSTSTAEQEQEYVLNINSKKFHLPDCSGVTTRQSLIDQGYSPCGTCKP